MKTSTKFFLLTAQMVLVLMYTGSTYAQKKESYRSVNGFDFSIGDSVILGVGSAPDGRFKFIYESVARTIFATLADEYDYDFRLPEYFQGAPVVILKIKEKNGKTFFYFDTDGWGTFVIDVEYAIASCEIAYCRPDGFLSQEEYEKLILLYQAVNDNRLTIERFEHLRNELLQDD